MTEKGVPNRRARVPGKVRVQDPFESPKPPHGEVVEDRPGVLVGTFFLPNHPPADVKYHVGRRTITLWSRKAAHPFQTILVLPKWVNPRTVILSHNNGMYEFHLEVAPKPPAPGHL